MFKQSGFTLLELIVVVSVLGLLTAIALPSFAAWREQAVYRKVARELASALRETRSRAIKSNLEHRLEVDLKEKRFRLTHGDRPVNSSDTSWNDFVVFDWADLGDEVILKGNQSCNKVNVVLNFHFNPNGTANSQYVCILDQAESRRFLLGVPYAVTGRTVVRKWRKTSEQWE